MIVAEDIDDEGAEGERHDEPEHRGDDDEDQDPEDAADLQKSGCHGERDDRRHPDESAEEEVPRLEVTPMIRNHTRDDRTEDRAGEPVEEDLLDHIKRRPEHRPRPRRSDSRAEEAPDQGVAARYRDPEERCHEDPEDRTDQGHQDQRRRKEGGVDDPSSNGCRNCRSEEERAEEVEDPREEDRLQGGQGFCRDDGGDRVGGIVQAVCKIKEEG